MKNNLKLIVFLINFILFISIQTNAAEQFNFNITEIEITENGNKFKGYERGKIITDNGIVVSADQFEYNKSLNILKANGNVKIVDEINNYIIYTRDITYLKNEEKILTKGYSKAISGEVTIESKEFIYNKILNILDAVNEVKIEDNKEDIIIFTDQVTYKKNHEQLFTKGITKALIEQKYNFISKDVFIDRNKMELISKNKSEILDNNNNLIELDEFIFYKFNSLLKGQNVEITTNHTLNDTVSDKYYFRDGFFDLKRNNFRASDTEISMHKGIFGNINNDPRLKGVSSHKKDNITQINKGIFTSCKKSDDCPPWSIQAEKIKHDKTKKQLIYDNALLKIYDIPVVYFPKFFHPDPTVERQSGILVPQLNESQILGSSIQIPYFHVISKEKDITFRPNIFDKNIIMIQNEYREKTENSTLIADFAFTNGYKSSLSNKKKNISHLFAKYNLDLKLKNFLKSDFKLNVEKVTNDTYLKVFDSNLFETAIKPSNKDKLTSSLSLNFEHEDFSLSGGITSYESLSGKNSDRYQFILPYYNFSKNLFTRENFGSMSLNSLGSNNYKDTNNVRSRIVNDINFESFDLISNLGIKNNINVYLKNLNTVAKNDPVYKSSPQLELMSIFEAKSSFPLINYGENFDRYFEPKISLRFNPGDMKDYSNDNRKITASNIFDINRLGLTDTFEEGKSLTIGIDYKKEKIKDINKYFEFKLASVFREGSGDKIPNSSAIKQSGNLFGSLKNNINENLNFIYNFSTDNDIQTI